MRGCICIICIPRRSCGIKIRAPFHSVMETSLENFGIDRLNGAWKKLDFVAINWRKQPKLFQLRPTWSAISDTKGASRRLSSRLCWASVTKQSAPDYGILDPPLSTPKQYLINGDSRFDSWHRHQTRHKIDNSITPLDLFLFIIK